MGFWLILPFNRIHFLLSMTNKSVVSDLRPAFTREQLISQIRALGIGEGDLLHLKVSLKSLGPVEGGAQTLLDAFLEVVGASGTLVVDAFIKSFKLPMSATESKYISSSKSIPYTGYFNQIFVQHPAMVRSRHPVQRFAAIGALAHELMDNHTPFSPAYDVLERLAIRGARNINVGEQIIGVGTTHVAIEETSLRKHNPPMGINYLDSDEEIKFFRVNWMGGCSRGCVKYVSDYERLGYVKRGSLGYTTAMVTDMKGTLAVDRQWIARDPSSFFCDDPTCKDCQLRWDHSTGNWVSVKWLSLMAIIKNWLK